MTGLVQRARRGAELARFFYAQRVTGFTVPAMPHLDDASTRVLEDWLRRAAFYLEFGMGGSTMLRARLGGESIAIESDPYFVAAVTKALVPGHAMTLIHANVGFTLDWGRPLLRTPTPARVRRWRTYVDLAFAEIARRGRFPDFVLVDGRFRVACTLETARQAALAGATTSIMLDDYADRPRYHGIEASLGPPARIGRAALWTVPGPSAMPITIGQVDAAMHDMW